jgi:hypothetical protein
MKKLCIVVPYRRREAHLQQFVPHLRLYFTRDKTDCAIPYRVLIVEQTDGLPFNRGALKNVGYVLGSADSDYTCFHDVDYLPIWADYSWPDKPMPIAWYGADVRPIAPNRSNRVTIANPDRFFGAVVLVPNRDFERINGYSNSYWGWGFEDTDLQFRFDSARIAWGRRRGSFQALDHDNQGFNLDGTPSPIAQVNERLFKGRWPIESKGTASPETLSDGLS